MSARIVKPSISLVIFRLVTPPQVVSIDGWDRDHAKTLKEESLRPQSSSFPAGSCRPHRRTKPHLNDVWLFLCRIRGFHSYTECCANVRTYCAV